MLTLGRMRTTFAQDGRLEWIGLRPARYADVASVDVARITQSGLSGDHGRAGKRAVTLIQAEHFQVIAALAGLDMVTPADLRRNLVISGLNLLAIRQGLLRVGACVLQIEGPCPPCSRMERALGTGAYNAIRGHGGWYASVAKSGVLQVGDRVQPGEAKF